MASLPPASPVVLDGVLSEEKLDELLALGTEYAELDFKSSIDPSRTEDIVELAKDIGGMQVRGAYVVIGVDGRGLPTDGLEGVDPGLFDEARLVPKLLRYLPEPLVVHTRTFTRAGHPIVLLFIARHPDGCAIFRADGQYQRGDTTTVSFRQGEIFWRNGTRTERLSQEGLRQVLAQKVADAKGGWLAEQEAIRAADRAALEAAYASRSAASGPLGAVSLDVDAPELSRAGLEMARARDEIGLKHLLKEVGVRARSAIERNEIEVELRVLLDKVTCLAATFIEYDLSEPLELVIDALVGVFDLGFEDHDPTRFDHATSLEPSEKAPRVWLLLLERIYALGALAVRRRKWKAVRALALQKPAKLDDYYQRDWLDFALIMASRASHFEERRDDQTETISLLSRARLNTEALSCVNPDGADGETVLSSMAQFDLLVSLRRIDATGSAQKLRYPNFGRFYEHRLEPVVEELLQAGELRTEIFPRSDEDLATALTEIGGSIRRTLFRFNGFREWPPRVVDFIDEHFPQG